MRFIEEADGFTNRMQTVLFAATRASITIHALQTSFNDALAPVSVKVRVFRCFRYHGEKDTRSGGGAAMLAIAATTFMDAFRKLSRFMQHLCDFSMLLARIAPGGEQGRWKQVMMIRPAETNAGVHHKQFNNGQWVSFACPDTVTFDQRHRWSRFTGAAHDVS